ncbi:MAG TPA: hypothetical protein VGP99_04035, partial [Tepidisphaeraceae bacterium]|nr:hypothetical protein [Tepidisphaeraceae bacterium]
TSLSLRQRDDDGSPIPWGTTTSGSNVRIEVAGADPQRVTEIELLLSRDGAPPARLEHGGNGADLKQLAPGRYRWSAVAHLRSDKPMVLEPPRGDPLAADFVVSPLVLELPPLEQRALQGEERIEKGGQTKGGAKLGTEFANPLPGAVLEVEASPAATAFDGARVQRISVHRGDVSVEFAGAAGAYHWRARLVAATNLQTQWRAFGDGTNGDFVILDADPDHSPPKNADIENGEDDPSNATDDNQGPGKNSGGRPPKGKRKPSNKNREPGKNADKPPENLEPDPKDKDQDPKQDPSAGGKGGTSGKSYASGIGSGYARPLPSRVRPLASLWHLAFFRMALMFGGIITALTVVLLAIRFIKGGRHRAPHMP